LIVSRLRGERGRREGEEKGGGERGRREGLQSVLFNNEPSMYLSYSSV